MRQGRRAPQAATEGERHPERGFRLLRLLGTALAAVLVTATGSLAAGNSIGVSTDRTIYQPGDIIRVTFKYQVEPATAIVTFNQEELGCHYFVTLETPGGAVVASAGSNLCDFFVECREHQPTVSRHFDIAVPGDLACGIYSVSVRTLYNLTTPDMPQGAGLAATAQVSIILCQQGGCMP